MPGPSTLAQVREDSEFLDFGGAGRPPRPAAALRPARRDVVCVCMYARERARARVPACVPACLGA